uniref:Actin-related protein 6 n=4 Tax=Macrostomum lignano TaxID=282301 RepID=A0A1I8IF66_9PLAT
MSGKDTLIVDLGAGYVKIGSASESEPRQVINSVTKAKHVKTRVFVGNELDECKDLSGLYYQLPFQKGYLLNWELQKQVLDHCLKPYADKRPLSEWQVIVTEPCINFSPVAEALDEVLFEEYGFKAVARLPAAFLAAQRDQRQRGVLPADHACLVLDCGYSFSHAAAYRRGRLVPGSVRRVNVGGKVLTNYLKEAISYRQLMVMDETHVMNQCKEDACFVSENFDADLAAMSRAAQRSPLDSEAQERCQKLCCEYVLPDYAQHRRGFVRQLGSQKQQQQEQTLRLGIERVATPELLFRPSDAGIPEMGVAEALCDTLSGLPPHEQPLYTDAVVLAGGSCRFAGFANRLETELRASLPDDFPLGVRCHGDPAAQAWLGGRDLALSPDGALECYAVSRKDYRDHGAALCSERFAQFT